MTTNLATAIATIIGAASGAAVAIIHAIAVPKGRAKDGQVP